MNLKEHMPIAKLLEHPENRKLFDDIRDTNPGFWLEFVDSIRTLGILEPLIVNRTTMQVRSGNQRLKAAIEIGLEDVPVLLVDPEEDTDEEIRKMIASNVFRRTIDPFAMFEYIGRLRRGGNLIRSVVRTTHKSYKFVSAADIFNELPEEHQEALREWFREQAEGEKAKSEGEFIAMLRELESDNTALERELRGVNDERKTIEERVAELQTMIDERDIQIDELRDIDTEEERATAERTINDLLEQQRKLKNKIAELKESPDINLYLIECVTKQREINTVLKEIIANADALNQSKLKEFEDTLKRTFTIIKKGTESNNGQDDRRKLLDE